MANQQGLYGSNIGQGFVRTIVAELIGTALLVLAGTAVATAYAFRGSYVDLGAVALSFGLALAALTAALGHVSGAHLNPAVTLGLAVTRKFPLKYTPFYLLAQVGGACLAGLAVWYTYGSVARGAVKLGATFPVAGISVWQALVMEAIITFLLVLVIIAVATGNRVSRGSAALAAGFALTAAVFIGGPISGGAVNPARALGPMIVSNTYTDWWVYVAGPLAGGIAASGLYGLFLGRPTASVAADEEIAATGKS